MKREEILAKGIINFKNNNFLEAEKIFLQGIRLYPENLEIYTYLIPTLINQNKLDEALKYSNRLNSQNQKNELGLIYIGIIFFKQKNYIKAKESFQNSLKINQKNNDALINLGATLHKLNRNSEAITYLKQAIQIKNDNPISYHTIGTVYESESEFEKALDNFKKALLLNPNDFESIHGISLIQLSIQDYINGFKNFEHRWKRSNIIYKYENIKKLVSIENLKNKKILVWHEQGMGDTIQFSRYLRFLKNLGAEITFEVQGPLRSFLQMQFDFKIVEKVSNFDFDYQIPLLSLPYIFKTDKNSIPPVKPYFKFDQSKKEKWKKILNLSKEKINLGIAISGNHNYRREQIRKINLEYFLKLKQFCKIFIIQKELYEDDKILVDSDKEILFLGTNHEWVDFLDTSAIVENMDLIVTIDTSLPHLASSLNKETVLLLSKPADWRWTENNETTPHWYDSLKIIRQEQKGSWKEPMEELEQLIKEKKLNRK